MKTFRALAVALVVLAALWFTGGERSGAPVPVDTPGATASPEGATRELPAFLPAEARDTLALIERGGPFPHRQDGATFGNREGRLPARPRGYYREYTVETPGLSHRGARRIVTGGDPPQDYWYTDDHYRSFRPFQVAP